MSFLRNSQQQYLVQFNAGRCIREGNLIKPDLRKGLVYMNQGEDQLLHLYWKERNATEPDLDLIIFPDEVEFARVEQCTTGRVYLFNFKSSNEKHFFWMQSKNEGKDKSLVRIVNALINDPSDAMGSVGSPSESLLMGGSSSGLDNITQENILQFLRSAEGLSAITDSNEGDVDMTSAEQQQQQPQPQPQQQQQQQQQPTGSQPESSVNPEHLEQLQRLLAGQQAPENSSSNITLNDTLTPSVLRRLLADDENCRALYPFLPEESERTPNEVRLVAQSPQFQQALHTLSFALQSGELGPLLTQLGLDSSAGNGIEAFLRAIEEQARRKDRDNDNAMDED